VCLPHLFFSVRRREIREREERGERRDREMVERESDGRGEREPLDVDLLDRRL
jgi:hypothetical protein